MPGKLPLYFWTIKYMKPEQIFRRVGKKLGIPCTLRGVRVGSTGIRPGAFLPELDHDPVFLRRFSADELLADEITLLHERESFSWAQPWNFENRTPLWNFNLHYFEYLHSLTKRFLETEEERYLRKAEQMILGWIRLNPESGGGDGWEAYTVSVRLTNWLAFYSAVGTALDPSIREELEYSLYQQYEYLSRHLEKHSLGNHYFDNLKALILCALFFDDSKSLPAILEAFRKECREEILPDGMHFELSPMYHKVVLEGLLRVVIALQDAGIPDTELTQTAQRMLTAACSIEHGLSRTPLFNDSGDNVAKSLDALALCGKRYLDLSPELRESLPDAGYYFFRSGPWRLIVDAGKPGADYIPGHSHCDCMSFELYRGGEPVLTNSGTYAYQCAERAYFRGTAAHNTVQAENTEQSEIWSAFRLARRSRTRVLSLEETGIQMEMADYRGNRIRRSIRLLPGSLEIHDEGEGLRLKSYLHTLTDPDIRSDAPLSYSDGLYAPEFGLRKPLRTITAEAENSITITVALN